MKNSNVKLIFFQATPLSRCCLLVLSLPSMDVLCLARSFGVVMAEVDVADAAGIAGGGGSMFM